MKRIASFLLACCVGGQSFAAANSTTAALDPVLAGLTWGEDTSSLKQHFGRRAPTLSPPIEFGDAYVDVALRDVMLGGYGYVVYFQMDNTSHGLRRVMFERPRHGTNHAVFDAAVHAIEAQFGKPARCGAKPRPENGYQALDEYSWRGEGRRVRAIFRDTTLEAESGCQVVGFLPCGLEGHLFILVDSDRTSGPDCG